MVLAVVVACAVAAVLVGVLHAPGPPRRVTVHHDSVQLVAIATPAARAARLEVTPASHSAIVRGQTWFCTTQHCPPGPSVVTLIHDGQILGAAHFDRRLRFAFYVTGLPGSATNPGGKVVAIRLTLAANDGYAVSIKVAAGSKVNVGVPPVTAASGPGILGTFVGSNDTFSSIYSWGGRPLDTFRAPTGTELAQGIAGSALSPDGERLLVQSVHGAIDSVVAASGTVLGSFPANGGALWGDDSTHVCVLQLPRRLVSSSGPTEAKLLLVDPGVASRLVAYVVVTARARMEVVSCDPAAHVAILETYYRGQGVAVTYVNLGPNARGPVQQPAPWYSYKMGSVELSGNGKFAVTGDGTVLNTSTGLAVGKVGGNPVAISWLGHDVVVLGRSDHVAEVVDWQTGTVVWREVSPTSERLSLLASSRSGSDELAIELSQGDATAVGLWWVSDGGSMLVSRSVAPGHP